MQVKTMKVTISFAQPVTRTVAERIAVAIDAVVRVLNGEAVSHIIETEEESHDPK